MSTALYYFLSTVAQTFAAAIALLGALALYRLQALRGEIERSSKFLIDNYHKDSDELSGLLELFWGGKYVAIYAHYQSGPGRRGPGTGSQYFAARTALQIGTESHNNIRHYLSNSMALTLILLVISIASIPLVPIVAEFTAVSIALIVLVLCGVGLCLKKYTRLVKAVLQ